MIGFKAPTSPRHEMERAQAIAIDWGNAETRGLEEAGNISSLVNLIRDAIGERLGFRFLRRVLEESPAWGREGAVVDTTERDEFEALQTVPGRINHWHFGERVSPAVMVMETNESALHAHDIMNIVFHRAQMMTTEKRPPSVTEVMQLGMDWTSVEMLLFWGQQPTAALPAKGMSPEDIIRYMEENGITCSSPYHIL